jgi:hypothetical protein
MTMSTYQQEPPKSSFARPLAQLVIEHTATFDLPDGQVCPPLIERGAVWCVVRRGNDGHTLWRRTSLSTSPVTDWRPASGRSITRAERIMKMDMSKYSGGSFVKVADVKDGPIQEQIAVVKLGKWDRPNLVFESGGMLSVNATNNAELLKAYGKNSDDWIGKEIELYLGEIEFQNQPQEAVLVRPISPPLGAAERTKPLPEPEPAAKPKPQAGPPFDDDLPKW